MILIADSGASKTDWRVIDAKGQISQYRGLGFNPYYQDQEDITRSLQEDFFHQSEEGIKSVYYYGAGCSNIKNKILVKEALQKQFKKAVIFVEHDLLAAARSTCGHEAGIACILGTGSNSCDYNGKDIINSRPSPGFILGDEGGGAYIGKQFLKDFIYEEMPAHISEKVKEHYALDYTQILENVYQKPFPGRYMASFCRFITQHKADPYCYNLVYQAFKDFFAKHVQKYPNHTQKKVNFVGSIAHYNSDILRKAAADLDIHANIIIESPIAGLTLFHQANP
ncbi:N-acetylglucosamine kinase [Echinicola jeungdonensis]|uniref:N-acetylglucosamine kinase n=1 Tax=Echinicola jeungdonensis TaxID=709343 RepID=A0ABV5J677_9BACT|nr:N-acetylglucosamine kinase [Echinicola jeungdonensis]MDN3668777.1 N-acetylglucosamine kinase [Echinicola jeungdonensis]